MDRDQIIDSTNLKKNDFSKQNIVKETQSFDNIE